MGILKRYKCMKSNYKKGFTVGAIYPLYKGDGNYIVSNNNVKWYEEEFPLIGEQMGVELKEMNENKMLNFKEGQTYICTNTGKPWWTEGKEYKVFKNPTYDNLVIKNDEGITFAEDSINCLITEFKLKEESTITTSDLIDNQTHYKNQEIEPIELMRKNFSTEEFSGFLQGNVLKYMLRYKDKNGVEDLKKAKTYLTWLIEEEEK